MQKNLFYLFSFLFALWVLLPSCKKEEKCDGVCPPKGRVLEYGTNIPIEGAEVQLYEYFSDGPFNGYAEVVERVVTDADGNYACSKERGIYVNATKANYFSDYTTEEVLLPSTINNTDIHLYPYAWLKVVYRNVSGAYVITQPFGIIDNHLFLEKGEESTFINIVKGNKPNKYILSCYLDEWITPKNDGVLFMVDPSIDLEVRTDTAFGSYIINYTPIGHDTTTITITF